MKHSALRSIGAMETEKDSSYVPRRPSGAFPRPPKVRKCDDSDVNAVERVGDDLDPVYPFCTLSSIGPLPPLFQVGDGLQISGTKLEVKVLDPVAIKNTAVSVKFDNCSIGLNKAGELTVLPRIVFQITTELPVTMEGNNRFSIVYDKKKGLQTIFPGVGLSVKYDNSYFIVSDRGKLRLWWASPKYIPCEAPLVKADEGISLAIESPLTLENDQLTADVKPTDPLEISSVNAIQIRLNGAHFSKSTVDNSLIINGSYSFAPEAIVPMQSGKNLIKLNIHESSSALEIKSGRLEVKVGAGLKIENNSIHAVTGNGLGISKSGEVSLNRKRVLQGDDNAISIKNGDGIKEYVGAIEMKVADPFAISDGTLVPRIGRGMKVDNKNEDRVILKIESPYAWQRLQFDSEGYLMPRGISGTLQFDSEGYLTLT